MIRPHALLRLVSAPLVCSALITSGCGDLLKYEETIVEEVEVPGTGIGINNPLVPDEVIPVDFGAVISESLQQSFDTEGINKDAVKSLKITSMNLSVEDPEENGNVVRHLEFLERIAFSVRSGPDEDPVDVAESEAGAFEPKTTDYDMPMTLNELADVLKASDELVMDTDAEINERPTFTTTVVFTTVVAVEADVAGAIGGL